MIQLTRIDDERSSQTLSSTSEFREDQRTVSLLLRRDVLVCDLLSAIVPGKMGGHTKFIPSLVLVMRQASDMANIELSSSKGTDRCR